MNKIEVFPLDLPNSVDSVAVFAARLTQHGHEIKCAQDVIDLYNRDYNSKIKSNIYELPHRTLKTFAKLNLVVYGASRRFLAQITRHQNNVTFMSASLQYSDFSNNSDFVVPYNILNTPDESIYIQKCKQQMDEYKIFAERYGNDSAGYLAPQGLRNILLISATPDEWIHMIKQRICRRNTDETRYVMLKCWEILIDYYPELCSPFNCLPSCAPIGTCEEGKMSCSRKLPYFYPAFIIKLDYPLLYKGE